MPNSESIVASNLVLVSIYSLIIAAIIYCLSYLLSQRFRSLQAWPAFWLWGMVCVALSLIIGLIPTDYRQLTQLPIDHAAMPVDTATINVAGGLIKESDALTEISVQLAEIARILAPFWLIIYVAGLSSKSVLWLWRYINVLNVVSNAADIDPASQARIDNQLTLIKDTGAIKLLKQNRTRMLVSNAVDSPFVILFPKPTLIVSDSALERLSDAQLSLVLEHELIHLANRDPLLLTIVGWLSNLLWFNPFVQMISNRCRLSVEIRCDARTLANRGEEKRDYLSAMLSVINARHNASLKLITATFGGSTVMFIKARIQCIQSPVLPRVNPILRNALLVLGLILIVAANTAIQPLANAQSVDNKDSLIKHLRRVQPVQVGRVSSQFGPRIDPFTHKQRVHNGIDYAAKRGVPVVATGDGQVKFAGDKDDYGLRIDIDHGGSISTLYANLGELLVTKGQQVKQGDTIALMGVSGRSTGPHVHYEVRDKDQPICPSEKCIGE